MSSCSKPLLGTIAYVDVRSDNDNHSIAVSEVLESLGATIAPKLLPHVTHIIFKNGSRTTLSCAKQYKCKVVSVQWVERCNETMEWAPENSYLLQRDALNSTSKKQKSMQPKDFQEEFELASERLSKTKKRKSDIVIPSPLSMMASEKLKRNILQPPRTPPAMLKKLTELRERKITSSSKIICKDSPATPNTSIIGNSPVLKVSQRSHNNTEQRLQDDLQLYDEPFVTQVDETPLRSAPSTSFAIKNKKDSHITTRKESAKRTIAQLSPDNRTVTKEKRLCTGERQLQVNKASSTASDLSNSSSSDLSDIIDIQKIIKFSPVVNKSAEFSNALMSESNTQNKSKPKQRGTIVLTSFHSNDRGLMKTIIEKLGGFTISTVVDENTTHVVCGDGRRTLNVLRGISLGCWIVSKTWIFSSLENHEWLPCEQSYLMCSAFTGATSARRDKALSGKKIFEPIGSMYISRNTKPGYKEMAELICLNGGQVTKAAKRSCILIGDTRDYTGTKVKESWILDCVASQKLIALEPYLIQ